MITKTKYHSSKLDTPDGKFDSKREYRRWLELKAMAERGEITDLKRQVAYELLPNQVIDGKCVERSVKYVADFVYCYKGDLVVEDSKGFRTDCYRLKRKMLLYFHGIRIREV